MNREIKYFLEYKKTHEWVCIFGDLTNNPNNQAIFSFNEKWNAEDFLKELKPKWNSDFSGTHQFLDEGQDFMIGIQRACFLNLESKGINLYEDFIVTEHEFPELTTK